MSNSEKLKNRHDIGDKEAGRMFEMELFGNVPCWLRVSNALGEKYLENVTNNQRFPSVQWTARTTRETTWTMAIDVMTFGDIF